MKRRHGCQRCQVLQSALTGIEGGIIRCARQWAVRFDGPTPRMIEQMADLKRRRRETLALIAEHRQAECPLVSQGASS